MITENKLQAHIIQLQQTVINVLQDALYNGRSLTQGDMQRLIAAQQAAREGSLDALQGQYSRMLADERVRRKQLPDYYEAPAQRMLLEDDPTPLRKQLTFPTRHASTRSLPPPRRAESLPVPPSGLFCGYSEVLQFTSRPLNPAFEPSAGSHCPSCDVILPVDTLDVWYFGTEGATNRDGVREVRECRVDARFVVKCHTRDGRFACVLCNQYRDVDCICRSVQGLVKHLAVEHTPKEFEGDVDLQL